MENNQNTAVVSPAYPGTVMKNGSAGSEVARIQKYIGALRVKYPSLPNLTVDGKFGAQTASAVKQYQGVARLSIDGMVGRNTWNALIGDYNATVGGSADTYPGIPLRPGMRGQDVRHMQQLLNELAQLYTAINTQTVDGRYGGNMSAAVRRFQRQFGLSSDGILGSDTWNRILSVHNKMESGSPAPVVTPYPGAVLSAGSSGDSVRCVQSYLNRISGRAFLTVDGIYGQNVTRAVSAFQASAGLTVDGKVGRNTWNALIPAFNSTL